MKSTASLFFIAFFLSSCNPLNLDDKEGRERNFKVDPAEGKRNFTFPDLEGISGSEIVNKSMSESCANYRNASSFSIFGDKSPSKALQNCLAKAMDDSLRPLCEDEKKAKKLKRIYEEDRNYELAEEMEEYLYDLEETKQDTANEIYFMADQFYDQCAEWEDDLEEELDLKDEIKSDAKRLFEKFAVRGAKFLVSSECQGFSRVLDSRGRNPCISIDLYRLERE